MSIEENIKILDRSLNEGRYSEALDLIESIESMDRSDTNKNYYHFNLGYGLARIALMKSDLSLTKRAIVHLNSVRIIPSEFAFQFKFNFARLLIQQYHFSEDSNLTIEFSHGLLHSKRFYLELVNEHWNKGNLNLDQQNLIFHDLVIIAMEFGRWTEAQYYLGILEKLNIESPYTSYLYARLMDEISSRTCADDPEYPLFSATLLRHCETALGTRDELMKSQIRGLVELHQTLFERHNLDLDEVLKKKHEIDNNLNSYSKYRQFVLLNHLSLNEHSLFCKCSKGRIDNLMLINQHVEKIHPNTDKIKVYEPVVKKLIRIFHLARLNYYRATTSDKISDYESEFVNDYGERLLIDNRSELLIESFRSCFGTLDKIAHVLVRFYDQKTKGVIYFENVFHKTKLKEKINNEFGGFYLRTIYSIFMDLNRTEYSALKEFKSWRNAIEHKFLFLVEELSEEVKLQYPDVDHLISKEEFRTKTLMLLQLTRSAIFSLVYLLRRESKRPYVSNEISTEN